MLGRVLCALGRYDQAELLARTGVELGLHEDGMTQRTWWQTLALVHSPRAQDVEAERLAREAVDLSLRAPPRCIGRRVLQASSSSSMTCP
jgi:hypothetical protein